MKDQPQRVKYIYDNVHMKMLMIIIIINIKDES